ncbi:unnamed protein product [Paramecium octaurelia]|uniref:Uncharacterized protein n=1 Tax=Paramecium octaurelia TaxID=43137 RepID=A0A8S1U4T8_PAROT|nr:unnamed protein product [Paramecium octaurelia]
MDNQELTQKLNQLNNENENTESSQSSRVLLLIFDAIENFEYKYYKIAGCLYVIIVSAVLTFILTMRDKHFSTLPNLELIFISVLLMFCANFKMISQSNILPYIQENGLNWKVKHASLSLIIALVLLICSLKQNDRFVSVFFFVSVWPLNYVYENLRYKQELRKELLLPFCGIFIGAAFSTETLQKLASNPEVLQLNGIIYSIVGGLFLCYSADCFKKVDSENLFTITHVIGLMTVIFVPLFFPIEGLLQPGLKEWIFFAIVGALLIVGLPIMIRTFAIETATITLAQLGWCFPFYIFFKFLFGLQIPSFGQLCGIGVQSLCSILIIKYLNQQENKTQKLLKKGSSEANKVVELQTLTQQA